MDGSSLSLILIPIAVSIGLAAWLILVFHAASHPQWSAHSAAPAPARSVTAAPPGRRPAGHPAAKQPVGDASAARPAVEHRESVSAQVTAPAAHPASAA
jgi:predicted lipid-binding transport protein (Tim44 family)